jgi:RND family efflux transporter MFP subunit
MVLLLFGILGGCGQKNEYVEPPPPTVTVDKPFKQNVTDYLEFTGTTKAIETVDIRARVEGFLESAHFEEGTFVEKGQLLYVIDPKPYQATLDEARATLENEKVKLARAEIEYQRRVKLFEQKATSEADVVEWKAERDGAKIAVAAARAAVEKARLDLGYTVIRAPITGRIGRHQVDVDNLVGAGEYTLLTTMTMYDPIYAYFSLNENDLLRVMQMARDKGITVEESEKVPLELGLADESGYPHKGQLDFADLGLEPGTGTMLLRGLFPNPGPPYRMIPGFFARVRMPIAERKNALLVTERALGIDQGGNYLLVVNDQNVVEQRHVKVGAVTEGKQVIVEGLKGDEWVVVKGLQRAIPGAKVTPEHAQPAKTASVTETASEPQEPHGDKTTSPE